MGTGEGEEEFNLLEPSSVNDDVYCAALVHLSCHATG